VLPHRKKKYVSKINYQLQTEETNKQMTVAKYILLGVIWQKVLTNGPVAQQLHDVAGIAYEGN
jgi:hypothetical protein